MGIREDLVIGIDAFVSTKKGISMTKKTKKKGTSGAENFRKEFNSALPKSGEKAKISKKAVKKAEKMK